MGLSLPSTAKDVFDWRGAVKEHVDADTASASSLRAAHTAGLRPFVDAVRAALREGAVPGPVTLRWCVAQCLRLLAPLSLDAEGSLSSDGNLVVAALKGLVATDRVSAVAHPKLVPTALRLHQLTLLELCIRHVPDISETTVVHIIRYLVERQDARSLAQFATGHLKVQASKPEGVQRLKAIQHFVCLLVCYNVNDLFLEVRLKRLVLPEVTLVLGTLLQLVQVHTKETLPAHPSFKSIRVKGAPTSQTPVPCYEQVLDWIRMLVDAHVSQLVLGGSRNEDVAQLLKDLQRVTGEEVATCESIQSLQGHVGHVVSNSALPIKPVADFSVDTLWL